MKKNIGEYVVFTDGLARFFTKQDMMNIENFINEHIGDDEGEFDEFIDKMYEYVHKMESLVHEGCRSKEFVQRYCLSNPMKTDKGVAIRNMLLCEKLEDLGVECPLAFIIEHDFCYFDSNDELIDFKRSLDRWTLVQGYKTVGTILRAVCKPLNGACHDIRKLESVFMRYDDTSPYDALRELYDFDQDLDF